MTIDTSFAENPQRYVDAKREQHGLPALSVALWHKGQLHQAASGCLNVNTGVNATTDSVFTIASITKVMTATLILQLMDEGLLDLEKPVKQYLRDFQLADKSWTEAITVAQLLDHTSGIPGDFIPTLSWTEENAIARYVDRCNLLEPVHAPGEKQSYSNAAYTIAGRLIEVVSGSNWYDAIQERIVEPLELKETLVHPTQALKYRAAMGHVRDPENPPQWIHSPSTHLSPAWSPAGSAIMMSTGDLIKFAQAFLRGGLLENGERWLSEKAFKLSQQHRIALPENAALHVTHWGLGWHFAEVGTPVIGHTGNSSGQRAMMQYLPEHDAAFSLLLNGDCSPPLGDIMQDMVAAITGVELKRTQALSEEAVADLSQAPIIGRYAGLGYSIEVACIDGELQLYTVLPGSDEKLNVQDLKPHNESTYAAFNALGERQSDVVLIDRDAQQTPAFIYSAYRLFKRMD